MKKLFAMSMFPLLAITLMSCNEEKLRVVTERKTLNGTSWKKFEFRQGNRDVFKILTFKAPNIVNIAVRDDQGYLVNGVQEEYTYIYEHPRFEVHGPFVMNFTGRVMDNDAIEFQGETFLSN